jgi:hypothetical protein
MRTMSSNDLIRQLPITSVLAKVRAAIFRARDGRYKALALTDLERLEIWIAPNRLGNASQRQGQVIASAGSNVLQQLRVALASYSNTPARTRCLDMLVELEHWAAKAEVDFAEQPEPAAAKSHEVIETKGPDGSARLDRVPVAAPTPAPAPSKPVAAVQPTKPAPAPVPAVAPASAKPSPKPAAAGPGELLEQAPKPTTDLADLDPSAFKVPELRARLAELRPSGAFSADVEALEAMRGRELAAGNRSTALTEIDTLLDQALADNSTRDDAATGVLPSGSLPTS